MEIVSLLLSHGAKVNTSDKYGTTPLIWASRKGYRDIVCKLLEAGASVDNAGMVCDVTRKIDSKSSRELSFLERLDSAHCCIKRRIQ